MRRESNIAVSTAKLAASILVRPTSFHAATKTHGRRERYLLLRSHLRELRLTVRNRRCRRKEGCYKRPAYHARSGPRTRAVPPSWNRYLFTLTGFCPS